MKKAPALLGLGLILSLYLSGCGGDEVKSRPVNNPTPTTSSLSQQQRRQASQLNFPIYGLSFSDLKQLLLESNLDPSLTQKFSLKISEIDPNTLKITTDLGEAANVTLSAGLISNLKQNGLLGNQSDGVCQAAIEYTIKGSDGEKGGYSVERSFTLTSNEFTIENRDFAHFAPSGNPTIPSLSGDYTVGEELKITTPEGVVTFNNGDSLQIDSELKGTVIELSDLFIDYVNECIGEALGVPVTDEIEQMRAYSHEHGFE